MFNDFDAQKDLVKKVELMLIYFGASFRFDLNGLNTYVDVDGVETTNGLVKVSFTHAETLKEFLTIDFLVQDNMGYTLFSANTFDELDAAWNGFYATTIE